MFLFLLLSIYTGYSGLTGRNEPHKIMKVGIFDLPFMQTIRPSARLLGAKYSD